MSKHYFLPTAVVLSAYSSDDTATTIINISHQDYLGYPIAPASLKERVNSDFNFPLYQLVKREGPRLTFETYNIDIPQPIVGVTYEFYSWWIPDAIDAVLDTSVKWKQITYPDNGDHDHCLLTGETISAYDGYKEGYYSDLYGWITIEAHSKFIAHDILRIRK